MVQKLELISLELIFENSIFSICVGVWLGGHPGHPANFSSRNSTSLYHYGNDRRNGNELEADREFEFKPRMTTNLTATKIFRDF